MSLLALGAFLSCKQPRRPEAVLEMGNPPDLPFTSRLEASLANLTTRPSSCPGPGSYYVIRSTLYDSSSPRPARLQRTFDVILRRGTEQLSPELACIAHEQHRGQTLDKVSHPTCICVLLTRGRATETEQDNICVA